MSSSPSGATTIPDVPKDLLKEQAKKNPPVSSPSNSNPNMPLSPAPKFEPTDSQPVPPLKHTEASYDLIGNGKPHTPSIASSATTSSLSENFSDIQEKVVSGLTAAGQTASIYMNALEAGKGMAERIKVAATKPSAESTSSDTNPTTTTTRTSSTTSTSSSPSTSFSSKVTTGLTAAGQSATALVNEAIEAGRGVAGRLSGTSSKPSGINSEYSENIDQSPSFQSQIVNGIENFSTSASHTFNSAMSTTKTYASKVDESLGVSAKLHYVDEKLGVSCLYCC